MKTLQTIAALTGIAMLSVGTAKAGGLAAPVMPAEVVVQETATASHDWVVPLLGLAVLVAIATASSAGGGVAGSDARLKTDVKRVGVTAHGLPLYHFRYIGQPEVYEGVMAQDVARVMPDAVITLDQGVLAVNYDMLGIKFRQIR